MVIFVIGFAQLNIRSFGTAFDFSLTHHHMHALDGSQIVIWTRTRATINGVRLLFQRDTGQM
jgi:hypothetical protein